jgi:hypothetical protein
MGVWGSQSPLSIPEEIDFHGKSFKKRITAPGCSSKRCFLAPAARESPMRIPLEKVDLITLRKEGVKWALPRGCFPVWGREGVTLNISIVPTGSH